MYHLVQLCAGQRRAVQEALRADAGGIAVPQAQRRDAGARRALVAEVSRVDVQQVGNLVAGVEDRVGNTAGVVHQIQHAAHDQAGGPRHAAACAQYFQRRAQIVEAADGLAGVLRDFCELIPVFCQIIGEFVLGIVLCEFYGIQDQGLDIVIDIPQL